MNGLDLFSGIGGITVALSPWVRPVAYCESDRYAQSVLLSRMSDGGIPLAPIWDDIRTLRGTDLPKIDIIYGGFPCQDISVAGRGVGLEGKRSGLFFEIVRLAEEIKPSFLFLENVPAIRTRGLARVIEELSACGYHCRWNMLSAAQVGAPHRRERWFLLAHTPRTRIVRLQQGGRQGASGESSTDAFSYGGKKSLAYPATIVCGSRAWEAEPNVVCVADGFPSRVDAIRALGNAVVPKQAREAFEMLMGRPSVFSFFEAFSRVPSTNGRLL